MVISYARFREAPGVSHKKVKVKSQNLEEAKLIARDFNLNLVTARILAARGYKSDLKLKNFIQPTLKEGLPSPKDLLNLDKAAKLIAKTAEAGKSIAICCDFDVDGLSGAAQVQHFFASQKISSRVFVPNRFKDGYGLNTAMVEEIAREKFSLLLTIDYGTSNISELKLARKLGLKTIVMDHHHVAEVPPADIFINPQQKGCGFADGILCAAGLAWYLILQLRTALKSAKDTDPKLYLDLACLGTICDMVPLIDTNRVIARRGLELLSKTERPGLLALKEVIGSKNVMSCTDVSFGIGPRLNAAGRMLSGDLVIELLAGSDSIAAKKIAKQLNKLNAERQEAEKKVKADVIKQVEGMGTIPAAIVVWDSEFHTGVIGIVAQRLVELFYRPAVVMGADEDGCYKGSVRGIKDFSVVDALAAVSEHLEKFGGHAGAGGFSVKKENVDAFAGAFVDECRKRLKEIDTKQYAEADSEADLADIDMALVEELKNFAPCGIGNPNPSLLVRNLTVASVKVLKKTHLKVVFKSGRKIMSGLMWGHASHPDISAGAKVNAVVRPGLNEYNGRTEIQLTVQAVEAV